MSTPDMPAKKARFEIPTIDIGDIGDVGDIGQDDDYILFRLSDGSYTTNYKSYNLDAKRNNKPLIYQLNSGDFTYNLHKKQSEIQRGLNPSRPRSNKGKFKAKMKFVPFDELKPAMP